MKLLSISKMIRTRVVKHISNPDPPRSLFLSVDDVVCHVRVGPVLYLNRVLVAAAAVASLYSITSGACSVYEQILLVRI